MGRDPSRVGAGQWTVASGEHNRRRKLEKDEPFKAPLRSPGQAGSTGAGFDWPFETQGKQTLTDIAQKYSTCQLLSGYHSNGTVKH